jgi:hypothetical protein
MQGSYQIGEAKVDVTAAGVVATLARTPQHATGFRNLVHQLGGVWFRGNRISFGADKAERVLDLFRTHFGMESDLDPLGLAPPASTRTVFVPTVLVVGLPTIAPHEPTEIECLQANLPTLERRERILRERHEAALRALETTRDRIADLAGRS